MSGYVSSFHLIRLTTELGKLNDLPHVVSRVGEQNTTAKMLLAPPAGLRSTCTAPSSGWIKFSPRWVHLTILFHLCLKRPQASASLKTVEPCMYLKDGWVRHDWQLTKEPREYLTSMTNCWIQKLKQQQRKKHLGNILLISRICLVYIVTFCCKNHLQCILLAGLCV